MPVARESEAVGYGSGLTSPRGRNKVAIVRWGLVVAVVGCAIGCGPSDSGGGAGPTGCERDATFDGNECVFPGTPGPAGFPTEDNSEDLGTGVGRCNPRGAEPCAAVSNGRLMPTGRICCSDDPAAPGGVLPAFAGRDVGGDSAAPYFAGANNEVGVWGLCVEPSEVADPLTDAGAQGCPVPCNPTWDGASVAAVCGPSRVCCQTRPIRESDCIEVDGALRPVRGSDILDGLTTWAPAEHETHQAPAAIGCRELAGGDTSSPEFMDCLDQLAVARTRGFCVQADACPVLDEPC